MAGLHQWKKYRVEYQELYNVREYSGSNGIYEWKCSTEKNGRITDLQVYTGYRPDERLGVVLTNPKRACDTRKGDIIYATYANNYEIKELYHLDNPISGSRNTLKLRLKEKLIYYSGNTYYGQGYYTTDNYKSELISVLEPYVTERIPKQGDYLGLVQGRDGEYPQNGEKDGYWYVYDKALNKAPYISGSNLDLGSKDADFTIDYVVFDPDGDVVTVDVLVDGIAKIKGKRTALGVNQKYQIKIDDFNLGDHKVEIRARDSKGMKAIPRIYYFTKSNTAPMISGKDEHLGDKSTGFSVSYRVEDKDKDPVSVRISLDDVEMASISDAQGKDLRFTLEDSKVRGLEIGKTYTITIKADDGKGGVAYRRYTFTKVNTPPIISGVDSDLGQTRDPVTIKFSVSDVEKDKIYFKLLLDDKEVMSQEGAEDGKQYTYTIDHDRFIRIPYGVHELIIYAWDDLNVDNKSIRKYSFERVPGGLDVEMKLGEYTTKPKKIVAVPHGEFNEPKIYQVLACNNYLDKEPTWEDITNMSKIARAYTFTNTTKTAAKWSIAVRVIIENGDADISSILRGAKGGIE